MVSHPSFLSVKEARSGKKVCLDGVDLGGTVAMLKIRVSERLDIPVCEQRVIYLGQVLQDDKTLESYGFRDGVTCYLIRKEKEDSQVSEDNVCSAELTQLLETAINNPLYRHSVKRILQDSEALEQLIIATPALKKDPVAMALLKDPELLLQISETANVERIVEEHPTLVQAASYIVAAIAEDSSSTRQILQERRNAESELENDELQGFEPQLVAQAELVAASEEQIQERQAARVIQSQSASSPQQISAAQLASALSQAQGSSSSSTSQTANRGAVSMETESSQVPFQPITSDLFTQAMASAISSVQTTNQANQAALQQMRDMGITDDSLSLRALAITSGDVQAALNLIFEGSIE